MASSSFTPQLDPRAKIVSYSGPSVYLTLKGPSGTAAFLPQTIGQPQQPVVPVRYVSASFSPLSSSASGK